MSGGVTSGAGHAGASPQSKGDGHSTLNENTMLESSASKPAGGSVLPPLARRCRV